jgi:hypothetical protein
MGAEFSECHSVAQPLMEGMLAGLLWTAEYLDEFSLNNRFDLSAADLKDQIPQLKPISELALTIWLLRRSGVRHEFLDEVPRWIWEQIDSGKMLTKLLLARNDFLPCCSLFGPLYQLGYRSQPLEKTLNLLSRSDMAKVFPLAPWAALAIDYNLSILGCKALSPDIGSLYVGALPEPWVVSSEIAYAITHEVFYLTDFGSRRIDDDYVVEYLEYWLPYWGSIFLREKNYDLAGELAMSSCCISHANALVSEQLLNSVLAVQDVTGYVPGPIGAGTILHQQGDTTRRRKFLANYHTTLVALMACALVLRSSNP